MTAEKESETRTITTKISENAAKHLRVLAAEEDRGIGEIVREALDLWWEAKGHLAQRGVLTEPMLPNTKNAQ